MRLPTHIYKHVPMFWFLGGLVCISSAVYLGFEHGPSIWYLGIGCLSVGWSIGVFVMRSGNRSNSTPSETVEDEQPG